LSNRSGASDLTLGGSAGGSALKNIIEQVSKKSPGKSARERSNANLRPGAAGVAQTKAERQARQDADDREFRRMVDERVAELPVSMRDKLLCRDVMEGLVSSQIMRREIRRKERLGLQVTARDRESATKADSVAQTGYNLLLNAWPPAEEKKRKEPPPSVTAWLDSEFGEMIGESVIDGHCRYCDQPVSDKYIATARAKAAASSAAVDWQAESRRSAAGPRLPQPEGHDCDRRRNLQCGTCDYQEAEGSKAASGNGGTHEGQ
jgi:hypothetical protein